MIRDFLERVVRLFRKRPVFDALIKEGWVFEINDLLPTPGQRIRFSSPGNKKFLEVTMSVEPRFLGMIDTAFADGFASRATWDLCGGLSDEGVTTALNFRRELLKLPCGERTTALSFLGFCPKCGDDLGIVSMTRCRCDRVGGVLGRVTR